MPPISRRSLAWLLLLGLGTTRLGADAFDRWLLGPCWQIPSLWHAIASAAIRAGSVDARFGARDAAQREAFVPNPFPPRLAVVVLADGPRARVSLIDEVYRNRGSFERAPEDPRVMGDQTRGFGPLSHLWPVHDWDRDGRLETLIALGPTHSGPLSDNVFAYLALGADQDELLFAIELRSTRELGAVLDRDDADGDGDQDLVVRPYAGRRLALTSDSRPLAAFLWDASRRRFVPELGVRAAGVVAAYWCGAPGDQLHFGRSDPVDPLVQRVLERARKAAPAP